MSSTKIPLGKSVGDASPYNYLPHHGYEHSGYSFSAVYYFALRGTCLYPDYFGSLYSISKKEPGKQINGYERNYTPFGG